MMSTAAKVVRGDGPVRLVKVDPKVYGMNAVLKSAYWLTDRAFVHLQFGGNEKIEVRLRSRRPETPVDTLAGEFMNELLDQQLRATVAAETVEVRDLIFRHALSNTSLLNRDLETADPFPDESHAQIRPDPAGPQA